jgi:hypothetical protein
MKCAGKIKHELCMFSICVGNYMQFIGWNPMKEFRLKQAELIRAKLEFPLSFPIKFPLKN